MDEPLDLDVLRILSKEEIRTAAAPHHFPFVALRNRSTLCDAVFASPPDVQDRIRAAAYRARVLKIDKKRKQDRLRAEKQYAQKRRRRADAPHADDVKVNLPVDASRCDIPSDNTQPQPQPQPLASAPLQTRDVEKFLDLPTAEELKDLHRSFRHATSNDSLAQKVCASCARQLMQDDLTAINYLTLPNRVLLVPHRPHEAHVLTDRMLLVSEHLDTSNGGALGWICAHCLSALKRNKRPAYSLSNNMWIGPIPPALAMLTLTEQLLISLRYPRGYIYKLFSSARTGHPDTLQSSMKGNVTTYNANVGDVVKMLQGQLMPRAAAILPSLIAITFIGRQTAPKSHLRSIFRVRRKVVHAALLTLKHMTKHPGYVNLEISEDALALLPEDDIPEEILVTMRQVSDIGVVARESAGYVPPEVDSREVQDPEEVDTTEDEDESEGEDERESGSKGMGAGRGAERCEGEGEGLGEDASAAGSVELSDAASQEAIQQTDLEPDVIPLEFSGLSAADGAHITPKELMLSAIENLRQEMGEQMTYEGGYAVRHGGFARDLAPRQGDGTTGESTPEDENLSAWTFPTLFPYGIGGLEAQRLVPVSFTEHTRVCLQHHDRRFRKDHTFPFWAMSIQQKRQALGAARLTMSRADYERTSATLSELTEADLVKAAHEEETGQSFSDPRVTLLRKMVQVTMQKVMGSDASRALNRSKMWSTSLYLNPVNLWMTLNFVDRHDPICQVFAGQDIDMDNLQNATGLSAHQRAVNVAKDPYAATQFFFFLANTILETLFGFTPKARTGEGRMGVLGQGSAYYGMVEAQGRGSLHLHMLMWLCNSPNAEEIAVRLRSETFKDKIKAYLRANIRSHLEDLTENVLSSMEPTSELAWSRPPDPDSPTYDNDLRLLETQLVRSQQYHVCTLNTCLVPDKVTRRLVCKRRAPFQLSAEDVVTDTGVILTKRTVDRLNSWNPAVFYGGRCNNDIKFMTNGAETKAAVWYTTNYATKKQGDTFNKSAITAKVFVEHRKRTPLVLSLRESSQKFMFRCAHSLNKEMEYSGQQVMAYLMGLGDAIHSHTYTPIYWSSVVRGLKSTYPELLSSAEVMKREELQRSQGAGGDDTQLLALGAEAPLRVGVTGGGTIHLRSQLDDYRYRGDELEHISFLEYFVDTYEERMRNRGENQDADPSTTRPGRNKNTRVRYQPEHPRAETAHRVVRTEGHRNLPDIVGPWIERNDNPTTFGLHCASVLACLKPWRTFKDLKAQDVSWSTALATFLATASDKHRSICANIQYYYQCRESADIRSNEAVPVNPEGDDLTELDLSELVNGVAIDTALMSAQKKRELDHAEKAVAVGERAGCFGKPNQVLGFGASSEIVTADDTLYEEITRWTAQLKETAKSLRSNGKQATLGDADNAVDIGSISIEIPDITTCPPTIEYEGDVVAPPATAEVDISMLAHDQLRAFTIVRNHVMESQAGENPPQLLMQIQGEGGTGKSLVIQKVTELFKTLGKEANLRRSAYTGIAASLIEGSTLHQLTLLHKAGKTLSTTSIERLRATWGCVDYLIIDEVSMISKKTLAVVSAMIGVGKQVEDKNNSAVAFGGINVIIAGDFHQFPPVVGSGQGRGSLYAPSFETHGVKAMLGRAIYENFTTVVLLKEQFRNKDPVWQGILHRARYGECTAEDLKVIRSIILDPIRDKGLFTDEASPWQTAVLVTPRHAVRNKWNELASRSHCQRTGQKLVLSHAYDTYKNRPLNRRMQILANARPVSKEEGKGSKGDPGGLPDTVQLARGMSVMVTYNIETELDIANGARGVIERIIVHPDDEANTYEPSNPWKVNLTRPPACVLVRLTRTKAATLPGFQPGIVPIVPIRGRFKVPIGSGKTVTVQREQLPLTPAYAFTDYRSQGQSIPYVIIDIATPPSGGLTPFNAYVALSRSVSRTNARLLWNFQDRLFTTAPDEHLASEDATLERLDAATRLAQMKKQRRREENLRGQEMGVPDGA